MTNKQSGWILGVAAIVMMCGLLAVDVSQLKDWNEVTTPVFIGTFLGHLASVGTAFIGGKLIPTEPQNQRENDK